MYKKMLLLPLMCNSLFLSAFFTDDFAQEISNLFEQQQKQMESLFKKAEQSMRQHKQKGSYFRLDKNDHGITLTVEQVQNNDINVSFDHNKLSIALGINKITLQTSNNKHQMLISSEKEITHHNEEQKKQYYSHEQQTEVVTLNRQVDLENAEPTYKSSEELFTLFIPYKAHKKIAVNTIK